MFFFTSDFTRQRKVTAQASKEMETSGSSSRALVCPLKWFGMGCRIRAKGENLENGLKRNTMAACKPPLASNYSNALVLQETT